MSELEIRTSAWLGRMSWRASWRASRCRRLGLVSRAGKHKEHVMIRRVSASCRPALGRDGSHRHLPAVHECSEKRAGPALLARWSTSGAIPQPEVNDFKFELEPMAYRPPDWRWPAILEDATVLRVPGCGLFRPRNRMNCMNNATSGIRSCCNFSSKWCLFSLSTSWPLPYRALRRRNGKASPCPAWPRVRGYALQVVRSHAARCSTACGYSWAH